MLTAYARPQDSIKFSAQETKILLEHHLNYPRLQKISDSCDAQEIKFRTVIYNDSSELSKCNELIATKDKTISVTESQVKEKQMTLEKTRFWKTFWKRDGIITTFISAIEAGIIYLIK